MQESVIKSFKSDLRTVFVNSEEGRRCMFRLMRFYGVLKPIDKSKLTDRQVNDINAKRDLILEICKLADFDQDQYNKWVFINKDPKDFTLKELIKLAYLRIKQKWCIRSICQKNK